jgi:hypothetical protein
MRYDEAHEPDDAGHGHCAADRKRRAADDEPLCALRREAETRCSLFPECQSVETAGRSCDQQPARHHQRQGEIHVRETAIGEGAQHPEQDLEGGVRARCEIQSQRSQRGGECVDGDARKHDRQEVAALARKTVERGQRK